MIRTLQPHIPAPLGMQDPGRFQVYTQHQIDQIPQVRALDADRRLAMRTVAKVLPFRVNRYVIENLIDWDRVPNDPIFQLTFPQEGMLEREAFLRMRRLVERNAPPGEIRGLANEIRARLNPHPAGQQELNVPRLEGRSLRGMQHKYPETVLFFPGQGQTCHSYCTFCFRWAQFIGERELRFSCTDAANLHRYLRTHHEVSDLLVTGGDPMVMRARALAEVLEPLLSPELAHVRNIRIGTKSLTYWPYRYLTDPDAGDVLRLFDRLVSTGKHVAIMAHYNHWRELEPDVARRAIARVRSTGAVIRGQGPLLRHINDDSRVCARLWRTQVGLGIVPYYMFVQRDTGARHYFEVPLARAYDIYAAAVRHVSGLARTVRGPSMSTGPGKVEIQGVARIAGERVFVLRFIQGRNPDWVQRPFFARYDEAASWLDGLQPAFGRERFFYQDEYESMCARTAGRHVV